MVDDSPAPPRRRPAAGRSVDLRTSAADAIRLAGASVVLVGYLAGYWICLRWLVQLLLRA